MINRYAQDPVARAQWIRFDWVRECLKSADGFYRFVDTMADAIKRSRTRFFRWHDSGDIFSPTYATAIARVCEATPDVYHWLPTQSYHVRAIDAEIRVSLLNSRKPGLILSNTTVRPSTDRVNGFPPRLRSRGYAAGLTVYTDVGHWHASCHRCPKSTVGGNCASNGCRVCWLSKSTPTGFLVHGHQGRHTLPVISAKTIARRRAQRERFSAR